ncbi:MAG: hypothetical protein A3F68_05990 [Acidobacteria bacterium RIFCSPLOWO2_12_FULL_54_10]|nr:MAG: hypothetical protein A3F68_05990 [Acidobacteria bacterium RIFCSPLOWO2_12_FULL_54_10]
MQFTLFSGAVALWGLMTVVLVLLLIYRVVLGNHEEDQLFLSNSEAAFQKDQDDNLAKINRVDPIIKGLAIVSVVLIVTLGAIWLYQGLNAQTSI